MSKNNGVIWQQRIVKPDSEKISLPDGRSKSWEEVDLMANEQPDAEQRKEPENGGNPSAYRRSGKGLSWKALRKNCLRLAGRWMAGFLGSAVLSPNSALHGDCEQRTQSNEL